LSTSALCAIVAGGMGNPSSRLSTLLATPLDVLVIGGGIVGSGVARDAALRGLRVGLVDRHDFAFGTSSRSSRLLHGGLRYLAQGRIGMVREASHEKMILHRIAPHLAHPLPFVFPTWRGGSWKLWKLRIGVKMYDLLCGGGNLGKSASLGPDGVKRILPGLASDGLTGAVRYFDGQTCDARLVLDTLRSAESHGAILCNHAPLIGAERAGENWRCRIEDLTTRQTLELTSRTVVNAAGAWADLMPASRTKLRLTKGVHLVIERPRLPINDAVVMPDGQRILFAIPWGERVILGTTDTDYSGDRDHPTCDPEDVRYILGVTNRTFPHAALESTDIISTWAGLRPLIDGKRGAPSDISRHHQIQMTEPGWFDVAGGKLTTYRLMAEQTIDQIMRHLKLDTVPCGTATEPLTASPFSGIIPPAVSRNAVENACRNEWAIHLDDVMIRRTNWRQYHREHLQIAVQVAGWMSELLGWTDEEREKELRSYRERV
jgi:glycerol-3-phosphate dehydrogenase